MISEEGQVRHIDNSTRILFVAGPYDSKSCQLFMSRIRDSIGRLVYAYDTPQALTV